MPSQLLDLPEELILRIVQYVAEVENKDVENKTNDGMGFWICGYSEESLCALQHIRLCSRKFYNIATPVLFQRVGRYPHDDSRSRYKQILDNETIRTYVRELHINTIGDDKEEDPEESLVNKRSLSLVRKFDRFPKLKAVTLRFSPDFSIARGQYRTRHPQKINFRHAILREFFKTLTTTSITDVSILNLQNVNDQFMQQPFADFELVMSRLTSLALQICIDEGFNSMYTARKPQLHMFFSCLGQTWLRPACATLTRLTLYSNHFFGWLPRSDLTTLYFPSLTSLALGRYTFASAASIDWIICHAATLRYLMLYDCPILVTRVICTPFCLGADGVTVALAPNADGGQTTPALQHTALRWKDVFERLGGGEMTALREFRINSVGWRRGARAAAREEVENLPIELTSKRYAWYDDEYHPLEGWDLRAEKLNVDGGEEWRGFLKRCGVMMDKAQDAEDVEALRGLLQKLGMREGRMEPVYRDLFRNVDDIVVQFGA